MTRCEYMLDKLERCEDATYERAEALSNLLGELSERIFDAMLSGNYEKISFAVADAAEEIADAVQNYEEDEESRAYVDGCVADLRDTPEWWEEVPEE